MEVITKRIDIVKAFDTGMVTAVGHCCNCFHTWGAGVAKALRESYPRAFSADKLTAYGDPKKLGQFSCALYANETKIICNLYGQYRYGSRGVFLDEVKFYDALVNMKEFLEKINLPETRVGFPYRVGCDRAGGDWSKIKPMIEYVFGDSFPVIFCQYNPKR